jgi:hypothetical protein
MIEMSLDVETAAVNLSEKFAKAVDGFIQESIELVLSWSLENLRRNGSWNTGRLGQSGRTEYSYAKFEGVVHFSAIYATFVEFGTRPHTAPLGPSLNHKVIMKGTVRRRKGTSEIIRTKRGKVSRTRKTIIQLLGTPDPSTNPLDWYAWRKGKRRAIQTKYGVHTAFGYALWLSIMKNGTDAHPFLRPAIGKYRIRMHNIAKKYGLEIV